MKRSLIREHIFVLVFMSEFNPPDEMPEEVRLYMDSLDKKADEAGRDEIEEKFAKLLPLIPEIDKMIDSHSEKWSVSRMGKVELSIIRLAVYEIFHDDTVPDKVAINEAVELAKKYGQDGAGAFVNGVLAGILKDNKEGNGD
ncbi:MAG: transcription antitermination factor NusB [Lachnospiraceae bacterium]|nr:transcription antitermination factor NusB [Lachnospiraceae bacterium]MCR5024789.1 transcription antitermination factor NusB [Lachnospiraceae bacterium]